jgi:hypothetical protein
MNNRIYNYNILNGNNKTNIKNQNYNGSIIETTQCYFYICPLETELRDVQQMVCVLACYLSKAHLYRKNMKYS